MSDPVTPVAESASPPLDRAHRGGDVWAGALALVFVAVVAVVGWSLEYDGEGMNGPLKVDWPPLYADWLPHMGPGTPAALVVALLVVVYGPPTAARLPWRRLLLASWLAAMAWTWSLALIDGWHRGVATRLTTKHEYLDDLHRFDDVGAAVREFTQYILLTEPDRWSAHVAGHPPGAVLTFVALDRIGLDGGGWAGAWCITAGTSAVVAILVTLRALGSDHLARRAAPFLVLAPAAIWVGAAADGYFAAVAAWGLALLALSATRTTTRPALAALGAGLLLGWLVYLSYGLALMAIPAVAILIYARAPRPLPFVLAGAIPIAVAFTLAGFYWWEGYGLLVVRYYQGVAEVRPYSYWLWGNLANAVIVAGLASVAGVRRVLARTLDTVRRWRERSGAEVGALVVPVVGMLFAMAVADLSGMSKAETERIWLPFTLWLPAAAALLPSGDHRRWLLVQAGIALAVNHLLFTGW